MKTDRDLLIELERKFWQSLVDEQTDVALGLLAEPSFMVSATGAMKFDHATYRRMAEQGPQVVRRFAFDEIDVTFVGDSVAILAYEVTQVLSPRGRHEDNEQRMKDTSTWVKVAGQWRCAMHTETPAGKG